MVWTNIKDGEKGGNLARVTNGALWTSGSSGALFEMARLKQQYGITPATPNRLIRQQSNVTLASGLTRSFWAQGGAANQPVQTAGVAMELVSNNANDTAAGTGARSVFLAGCAGDGTYQSITVATNGLTAVSIGTWLEVNEMQVTQAGSGGGNLGSLSVRTVSGAVTQATAGASSGDSFQQLRYRVPAGRVAFPKLLFFESHGTTADSTQLLSTTLICFVGKTSPPGPGVQRLLQPWRVFSFRGAVTPIPLGFGFPLEAGDCFQPSVQNTTAFSNRLFGYMVLQEFIL